MTLDRVLDARTRAGLPPTPPCSTCGAPAIGYISWRDGHFAAWCRNHIDTPQQTSLMDGAS
ncbi:hypothetical protein [Mycobacterium branderi]|uniref:Uncharacterized protein n=1 Tax=Mycobacterium branderi TaxID=43348 RepID=A0ABM7KFW7_9MYCO|nr:hypothetical protein [Mycobacterium branderi]MCV7232788.1 hypothetical protein [Mycobacterium branderi]BBZ09818.1 hypothetical protein MBRA_00130 [Mycobacterium branderi]BBZ09889.1 hypothetical protein MBRA_00840 [Mycobacterium branderi]